MYIYVCMCVYVCMCNRLRTEISLCPVPVHFQIEHKNVLIAHYLYVIHCIFPDFVPFHSYKPPIFQTKSPIFSYIFCVNIPIFLYFWGPKLLDALP